jgi:hypothetical protein
MKHWLLQALFVVVAAVLLALLYNTLGMPL